jgi:hypothetical protein
MHPAVLLAALLPFLSMHGSHAPQLRLPGPLRGPSIAHAAVAQQSLGIDDLWSSEFGLPSAEGEINCAAEYRGQVYVGGSFERIGGVAAARIARWDGLQWQPVGAGFDGDVYSLQVLGDRLLAGGEFDHSGGLRAPGLAVWNASTWDTLPGFPGREVVTMTIFRNELAVSGGGAIRSWDGAHWSTLGTVPCNDYSCGPYALTSWGDTLVAGGAFDSVGTVAARGIAGWNGSAWFPLGDGVGGSPYHYVAVTGLTVLHGALIVGGMFDTAGTIPTKNVARFTAAGWDSLRSVPDYISDLAVWHDSLFAARDPSDERGPSLMKWDGATWESLASVGGRVFALSATPSRLLMTGPLFVRDDGVRGPRGFGLAAWNGLELESFEAWSGRMHGIEWNPRTGWPWTSLAWHDGRLFAAFSTDVVAGQGGSYVDAGSLTSWDGVAWRAEPGIAGRILRLDWVADTLWAGGELILTDGGQAVHASLARRVDGVWSRADTLSITNVEAVTSDSRHWFFAGRWTYSGLSEVWEWNGSSWRRIGQIGDVYSMCVHQGQLIAGGSLTTVNTRPVQSVAAWDGIQWVGLPDGSSSPYHVYVWRVFSDGTHLLRSTDVANWAVQQWTGGQWVPFGNLAGVGRGFAMHQGHVLVYGEFFWSDEVDESVMEWDGAHWVPLEGAPGPVVDAVGTPSGFYLAGPFYEAGNRPSSGIARWDGIIPRLPLPQETFVLVSANPLRLGATLRYNLTRPAHVRVSIFDLSGRERTVLLDRNEPAGRQELPWSAADPHSEKYAAGVYFAHLQVDGRPEGTVKLVLLP